MTLSRRTITIATGMALACSLTACASTETGQPTLVETKSPAQFLRNEAASRLIGERGDTVEKQEDYSAPCKSTAEDPKELYRSWRSTLLVSVLPESAVGVDQFVGALATSFAEDGWVLKESQGSDSAAKVSTMTKSGAVATLTFTSTEDTGKGASMLIEASGPCVLTGGPDSDEVLELERRD